MIVVYNPYAGDKLAEEYVSSHVKPALESAGRGCELVRTEYEGHAHEISTKLAQRSVDLEICLIGGEMGCVNNGMLTSRRRQHNS